MASSSDTGVRRNDGVPGSGVIVCGPDDDRVAGLVRQLGERGRPAAPVSAAEAATVVRKGGVKLVILDESRGGGPSDPDAAGVRSAALERGLPLLLVVGDDEPDPAGLAARLGAADDWVAHGRFEAEGAVRASRLLAPKSDTAAGGTAKATGVPADSQFFALVVHDLRTPLNVIGLSLRMISQAVPKGDPELDEDLRFVEENFRQIERMLTQLSDFYRLFEVEGPLVPTEFSPRRLVEDLLEARTTKAKGKPTAVEVENREGEPGEVALDPLRARLALQYVLTNATASADGGVIRLVSGGGPDRWVIEVAVDQPAPSSVQSIALTPTSFERLCGFAAERRGMDLAIAAKVTELFGGTARLDVREGRGTSVVLDWPARLASPTP